MSGVALLSAAVPHLVDEQVVVEGGRVYRSPWRPRFFDWAFNLDRGAPLRAKWHQIPSGLDLLVTHGPPQGILDGTWRGERVFCEELREAVCRARPWVHVFGHLHESYGEEEVDGTCFVKVCTCNLGCGGTNPPKVVDL